MFRTFTRAIFPTRPNSPRGQSSSIMPSSCEMSNTNGIVPMTSTFDWSNLETKMNQSHRAVSLLTILLLLLSPSLTVTAQQANNESQTGAVLWMQTSGERAALSYQAFALARMMLDRELRTRSRMRRAVIVDIDETIMDNSRNQAWLIKNQQSFNDANWLRWVDRGEATGIPGPGGML